MNDVYNKNKPVYTTQFDVKIVQISIACALNMLCVDTEVINTCIAADWLLYNSLYM